MDINLIIGALIAAAILGAIVFGLEKYIMPYFDPYLPDSAKKYSYLLLGLILVILMSFIKLGKIGKYIVDAGQVLMVIGFAQLFGEMVSRG